MTYYLYVYSNGVIWLVNPIHRLSANSPFHVDRFENPQDLSNLFHDFPFETVAGFSGGKSQQIIAFAGIIPYFSLFSSMYFRATTQGSSTIKIYERSGKKDPSEIIEGNITDAIGRKEGTVIPGIVQPDHLPSIGGFSDRRKWYVEEAKFLDELNKFTVLLKEDFNQSNKDDRNDWNNYQVKQWMEEHHMGTPTAKRFWKYFSGAPTQQIRRNPTKDGCGWPLGCVQNLPQEDAQYASSLSQEVEHSRPKTYDNRSKGDQYMCSIHNRWKTSNPLMDLGGMLWCIFGDPNQ